MAILATIVAGLLLAYFYRPVLIVLGGFLGAITAGPVGALLGGLVTWCALQLLTAKPEFDKQEPNDDDPNSS